MACAFYTAPPTFESVSLSGSTGDRSAFLMLSGPSLKQIDLSLLDARGIVTMAVNNAWSGAASDALTCVDDPGDSSTWAGRTRAS